MKAFIDTNVLVYAVSNDPRNDQAGRILRDGGVASVQVLNEFVNVAHKKLGHDWTAIEYAIDQFCECFDEVRPLTLDIHASARALARDHRIAFYDALIIASALEAGCDTLYSEDMQSGRTIDTLTIRNPFGASAP